MWVDTLKPTIMMNVAAAEGTHPRYLKGVFIKGLVQNNPIAQLGLHPSASAPQKCKNS